MRRIKSALSWIAVVLAFVVGLWALAAFGMAWVDFNDRTGGWFLRLFSVGGMGLLGLGLIAGSLAALRNRKRAGVIFLAFMPIAAFFLGYPNAGYLVWHADGGGYFESPLPLTAIGLTALFFAPFLVLLLVLRHRKLGIVLFVSSACLVWILLAMSYWGKVLVPKLAECSVPFAVCGSFWLTTGKLAWPPLLAPRPRTLVRRVAAIATSCLLVLCLDVAATLALSALHSSLFSGGCREKPPFTHPLSPYHAVFTARAIFVGRSINALVNRGGVFLTFPPRVRDRRVGDWAIGVVQERFWGLPSWSRLVLLTNYIYWQGETYFMDGSRAHGLLAHMLPIVEGGISCSRTRPEQNAIVDLTVLRKPPPTNGGRIVGFVRKPEVFVGGLVPPAPPHPYTNARITVTGPTGTTTVTTDQRGVYELDDVPPGHYTLQLLAPDNQLVGLFGDENVPDEVHVKAGEVREASFSLFWNGRIEGKVREDSGKPARAWVELIEADGKQLPASARSFLQTNDDGSYRLSKIPAGRYIVRVNPYGPDDKHPYNMQYYPEVLRAQDAKVFALAEGQEIGGIDFTVQPLAERTVQVRVTWPNGSPVPGATVYFAYEHTAEFDSLMGTANCATANQRGEADIHLFGNSRVRLFGRQVVGDPREDQSDRHRTPRVEAEVTKLPDKINLVLTSESP
jgi:hypothetical protein